MNKIRKYNSYNLGDLINADKFQEPIKFPTSRYSEFYSDLKSMINIRKVEEIIAENVKNGTIKCPCHLSNGQEAIAVGISKYLNKNDYIFGNHRSHGHYLAAGGSSYQLFAEVLGKITGCSKGMGGSMHICSPENGFIGSVPIVAATIPIAVGAGLTVKIKKSSALAVSYFGDGATEEGVFHESLNLASYYKLPVLFICENNLFSSHMHISQRQPFNSILRFAEPNGIQSAQVDGNNLLEMDRIANKAIVHIRNDNGPFIIEAVTYRFKGHVGHDENVDVGLERNKDLSKWKKRDPILRALQGLIEVDFISKEKHDNLCRGIEQHLITEWEQAQKDPFPKEAQLQETVYNK